MKYQCIKCFTSMAYQSSNYRCEACNTKIGIIEALYELENNKIYKENTLIANEKGRNLILKLISEIKIDNLSANYFRVYILINIYADKIYTIWGSDLAINELLKKFESDLLNNQNLNEKHSSLIAIHSSLIDKFIQEKIEFLKKPHKRIAITSRQIKMEQEELETNFILDFISFDKTLLNSVKNILKVYDSLDDDGIVTAIDLLKHSLHDLTLNKFIFSSDINEELNFIRKIAHTNKSYTPKYSETIKGEKVDEYHIIINGKRVPLNKSTESKDIFIAIITLGSLILIFYYIFFVFGKYLY